MKSNWLRVLWLCVAAIGVAILTLFESLWRKASEWVTPVAAPIIRPLARWVAPRLRVTFARFRARINQPTGPPRFAVAA